MFMQESQLQKSEIVLVEWLLCKKQNSTLLVYCECENGFLLVYGCSSTISKTEDKKENSRVHQSQLYEMERERVFTLGTQYFCGWNLQGNIISVTVAHSRLSVPLPARLLKSLFEVCQRSTDQRQKILSNCVDFFPQQQKSNLEKHCQLGLEAAAATSYTMDCETAATSTGKARSGNGQAKGIQIYKHMKSGALALSKEFIANFPFIYLSISFCNVKQSTLFFWLNHNDFSDYVE